MKQQKIEMHILLRIIEEKKYYWKMEKKYHENMMR